MTTFSTKYSFWQDRTVGDFVYRFGDYKITRRPVNSTLFSTFKESDDRSEICREWIRICDEAAAKKNTCTEEKHSAMKRDGWKNCLHCGKELFKESTNATV